MLKEKVLENKMEVTNTKSILNRLRRIEGQVRGVAQMVEAERYRLDIMHQIRAVRSALNRVESHLLRDHAKDCVDQAACSEDEQTRRERLIELIDVFDKIKR